MGFATSLALAPPTPPSAAETPDSISPSASPSTASTASAAASDMPWVAESTIHFASVAEGSEILGQADQFMQLMGPLERQIRLSSDSPVALETLLEFVRRQAMEWAVDDVVRLKTVVDELRPRLARVVPLWPHTITLVKSTGREENKAPHCRGDAIILPAPTLQREPAELRRILIHELFHILSRQSVERRAAMYKIVGFDRVDPIALPDAWRARRITNPDAPHIDCVIRLEHNGQLLDFAPVLLTQQEAYPSASNRSLFGELLFGLMPVEQHGERWEPTRSALEGRLWQPHELPTYGARIGRNTGYIIHPEEILADNFVHLIDGTPNLPDPAIVSQLQEQLRP